VVTGKPLELGGSAGRREATGRGVSIVAREAARHEGFGVGGARVAVQGFGDVGSVTAQLLRRMGARIVAVTDWKGGVYDERGLDVEAVIDYARQQQTVDGFPAGHRLSNEELLALDVDILVPAALENQITELNARRIKAKIIAEGANGPTTSEADAILQQRGVLVLPDLYLNAGGVTVSYFEWLKNLSHVRFGRMEKRFDEGFARGLLGGVERLTGKALGMKEKAELTHGADEIDLVNSGLEETMIGAYQGVRDTKVALGASVDLRTAAMVTAIDKVAVIYREMGIFP
jgi:glutamate dehydrogenase (NAD(P)+)